MNEFCDYNDGGPHLWCECHGGCSCGRTICVYCKEMRR